MAERVQTAIVTESLTKIYHGKQIALSCVNLEVEPGTVLAVLGPNGAGKTTLVKLLLGLQTPTAGRAYVLGQRMTPNAASIRRRIGYLPADPRFPAGMTPISYLDYVGRLAGLTRTVRRPRMAALLRAVDLLRVSGEPIQRSSTGMKARLAIAASLINDPELLIWDEPAQGLDPDARRSMLALMRSLGENKTLLLCSHNLTDVQEVCARALVLHEGHVIFHGELNELAGTSKPSQIEISLVGDKKEIAETVKAIAEFEELESCELAKTLLRVKIREDASHATALANVLVTLADHHIEMSDLKISGQAAESAIAHLAKQEGSRGFTRAYQPAAG
jgi:ABC-2 type transport system ATP-binding protein